MLKPIGPVLADVAAKAKEPDFPQFMFAFFNSDGDEVGDRVYALDENRSEALTAIFRQLAPKRATHWKRYRLTFDGANEIER